MAKRLTKEQIEDMESRIMKWLKTKEDKAYGKYMGCAYKTFDFDKWGIWKEYVGYKRDDVVSAHLVRRALKNLEERGEIMEFDRRFNKKQWRWITPAEKRRRGFKKQRQDAAEKEAARLMGLLKDNGVNAKWNRYRKDEILLSGTSVGQLLTLLED